MNLAPSKMSFEPPLIVLEGSEKILEPSKITLEHQEYI